MYTLYSYLPRTIILQKSGSNLNGGNGIVLNTQHNFKYQPKYEALNERHLDPNTLHGHISISSCGVWQGGWAQA